MRVASTLEHVLSFSQLETVPYISLEVILENPLDVLIKKAMTAHKHN